jgi:hypothetical protein
MPSLLRTCLYVFLAAQLLMPAVARAQSHQNLYARLLTAEEVRDVLHCPLCNYPDTDGPIYFVRTSENLNLAFADVESAIDAAELLNKMADAKSRCDRPGYKAALNKYTTLEDIFGMEAVPGEEMRGVLKLLHPRGYTPSLLADVVPPFQTCSAPVVVTAKHTVLRWSKR